jgi:hypothetical protein
MNKPDWKQLAVQIQQFSSFLRDELKLDATQSNRFATAVSQDLENLSPDLREALRNSSVKTVKCGKGLRLKRCIRNQKLAKNQDCNELNHTLHFM